MNTKGRSLIVPTVAGICVLACMALTQHTPDRFCTGVAYDAGTGAILRVWNDGTVERWHKSVGWYPLQTHDEADAAEKINSTLRQLGK